MSDAGAVEWLLEGDPAIRWQVMRDLLDAPAEEWEAERAPDGRDGLRRPTPWSSSTRRRLARRAVDRVDVDVLLLVACGLPERHPSPTAPVARLLERPMPASREVDPGFLLKRVDLCHLAFRLGLGAYFLPGDARLGSLGEAVLTAQFEDGGWNCHMRNHPDRRHSSFHTTFNVLENVRIAAAHGAVAKRAFEEAEARAVQFMLAHRLYRSDKTGAIIAERITHLTYPWHWHYTVLRGLDYLRLTAAIHDERLDDPIQLLVERRRPNGRWPLQKRIPGRCSWRWRSPATTVGGTPYGCCGSSGSEGGSGRPHQGRLQLVGRERRPAARMPLSSGRGAAW
jgi:hypothetical protein